MKISKIACAVAAASLTLSGVAFAQGGPNPPDDGRPGNSLRPAQPDLNRDRRPDTRSDRRDDRRDDRGAVHRGDRNDNRYDRHDEGRGAGLEHRFYRGGRLPPEYRGRQYVVDDWRGHHLKQPPRGYQWVQVGGDYVLVAVATGIILSVLLNQ